MCTLHANSAREALVKMCTLPLLAGENVSACVDIVVHLAVDAAGHRRVREIVGVSGRVEGGEVIETSEIFGWRGGRLQRSEGYPPRTERFEAVGIDLISALGQRAGSHRLGTQVVGEG
jgi:pilus assembly protein CpaF